MMFLTKALSVLLSKILRWLDLKLKPLTLFDCTIISSSIERPTIGSTAGALDEKRGFIRERIIKPEKK